MQRAGESRRTFQKTKCQNRGKDSAGSANLGLLCTLKGDEVKARRGDNPFPHYISIFHNFIPCSQQRAFLRIDCLKTQKRQRMMGFSRTREAIWICTNDTIKSLHVMKEGREGEKRKKKHGHGFAVEVQHWSIAACQPSAQC